ncbi:ABC transporter permease [Herbiconiux sp. A18JL235]|uniref:ABC transporter permease n=1 Tax=Herbiconiux sp. A18JL235 TaxID=3152363 RepID=A0AB39BFY3_9MICO
MRFLLRRAGFYLVAFWVSLTLNFFLPRLIPGDPASRLLSRIQDRLTPDQIASLKGVFGLSDDPLWMQYLTYLGNVFQGNLGLSISRFPAPVVDVIAGGLWWTILLGGVALIVSFIVGNILGVIGAWRRGGAVDSFLPPVLVFFSAFPYFWLAMLALFFLGFQLHLFPIRNAYDATLTPAFDADFIGSVLYHLVLPAGTVVLVSVGGWMLGMRNTMIGTLSEDYISMAEAKGLFRRTVMYRYAARNALLPAVTSFGLSLGFIISGALLTEIVFTYPGLGYQLLTAVQNLDYPLIQGLLLMITFAVLIANMLVDIAYVRLDPRVRTS